MITHGRNIKDFHWKFIIQNLAEDSSKYIRSSSGKG